MNINLNTGFSKTTVFSISGEDIEGFDVNWGDGTISNTQPYIHVYPNAGNYSILVIGCSGLSGTVLTENVCVEDQYPASINIIDYPTYTIAGSVGTFVVEVISPESNITLHFYASGSDSRPYSQPEGFWDHLDPRWRFLDENDNIISTATFSAEPIEVDTNTVAYSATYTFKYIDDMPKDVVLFVTQEIPDHNSRVYSAITHTVSGELPTHICITEDGVRPIYSMQWAGVPVPYMISFCSENSKLMHYISGNILSANFSSICSVITDSVNITTISVKDENYCFYTGGYLLTSTTINPDQISPPTIDIEYDECSDDRVPIFTEYRLPARDSKLTVVGEATYDGNTVTVSGVSNTFSVYPFEEYNKFRRLGESEDLGEKLKYYAFTDRMRNYSGLWEYVDALMGSDRKSLGSKAYFGIDRFVDQHSDIDRCNIKSILDSASEIGIVVDDYALNDMPYEIKRILDLASMPLEKIVGSRCFCNMNFSSCNGCVGKNVCGTCGFNKKDNVGDQLTTSDYITAGTDILYIENGGSTAFEILHVLPQGGSNVYPLSTLTASPIYESGLNNYCFFKWNNAFQGNPIESEIDYLSPFTSINPQLSSAEDWYGDGGVFEELLNYNLIKGLGLDS